MKAFLLLIFLMIPFISALQITEIELNPEGLDAGNEWIEFYSEEEINLEGYKIINNDEDEITLNFSFKGYYVYEFQKQWLDNYDEKIYLYKENSLIHETPIMEDPLDNSLTFSYCEIWEFVEGTKANKNNCEEEIVEEQEVEEEEEIEIPEEIKEFVLSESKKQTPKITPPIIKETIDLNPKTIKTNENSNLDRNNYSKYSIVLFCILLLFLLLKKPKKKNEFR